MEINVPLKYLISMCAASQRDLAGGGVLLGSGNLRKWWKTEQGSYIFDLNKKFLRASNFHCYKAKVFKLLFDSDIILLLIHYDEPWKVTRIVLSQVQTDRWNF